MRGDIMAPHVRRVLLLLAAAACGVAPSPLVPGETADSVLARGASPEQVEAALALAKLPPLAFARPVPTADFDDSGFWHACALLYDRAVGDARGQLARAEALAGWTASQGPLGFDVEIEDLRHLHEHAELTLTFDLLALVGLGRRGAAQDHAAAETYLALGQLEAAVWAAVFRVDRARLHVAALRLLHGRLTALLAEAEQDQQRIVLLEQRGWLPPSDAAFARGHVSRLRHELLDVNTDLAAAESALAVAAGLRPDHPAIAATSERTLDLLARADVPTSPAASELLERHPKLRAERRRYALAEAVVRRAAADAWPDLRVGPRATITPSETIPGGVLTFELPFPGANSRAVAAALAEREQQRHAVEATLVEQLAAIAAARAHLHDQLRALAPSVLQYEASSGESWRAARARFQVDAMTLMPWMQAIEQRTMALVDYAEAREHIALATLDLAEASGPGR